MSVKVTVQPTFLSGNGYPTTRLKIDVDCTEIVGFLNKYDVLLLTTLVIATPNAEGKKVKQETYEYSEIYRNIENKQITFQAVVYGYIPDESWIDCKTRGVLVRKE